MILLRLLRDTYQRVILIVRPDNHDDAALVVHQRLCVRSERVDVSLGELYTCERDINTAENSASFEPVENIGLVNTIHFYVGIKYE